MIQTELKTLKIIWLTIKAIQVKKRKINQLNQIEFEVNLNKYQVIQLKQSQLD